MGIDIWTLVLIFFARVLDVSIGTFRIILVSRGFRNIAPFLGFFEVLIWITAIGAIFNSLHGFLSYVVYAAGLQQAHLWG
jgi:uncharacterized protein YebE (UPF0316 family)